MASNSRFKRLSDDMRGLYIGIVGPQGLCDICFKIVAQISMRTKECQQRTLASGVVTMETLLSKKKSQMPYSELRDLLETGAVRVVDFEEVDKFGF